MGIGVEFGRADRFRGHDCLHSLTPSVLFQGRDSPHRCFSGRVLVGSIDPGSRFAELRQEAASAALGGVRAENRKSPLRVCPGCPTLSLEQASRKGGAGGCEMILVNVDMLDGPLPAIKAASKLAS